MSVCHASTIAFDAHGIAWFGPADATWRVPVERLQAIGELVGPEGHAVAFIVEPDGPWLQAPAHASGMTTTLAALSRQLGASFELRLGTQSALGSRVMWPQALAERALLLFEASAGARQGVRVTLDPAVRAYVAHAAARNPHVLEREPRDFGPG